MGSLVCACDTSASISTELTRFVSEIKSIAEDISPDRIDMLYWDTDVTNHETYEKNEVHHLHTSTKPSGGGGTDPSCVSQFVTDKKIDPECIVMFTDGYVFNWGKDLGVPTLWCIVNNKNAKAPFGKTIHVEV